MVERVQRNRDCHDQLMVEKSTTNFLEDTLGINVKTIHLFGEAILPLQMYNSLRMTLDKGTKM